MHAHKQHMYFLYDRQQPRALSVRTCDACTSPPSVLCRRTLGLCHYVMLKGKIKRLKDDNDPERTIGLKNHLITLH